VGYRHSFTLGAVVVALLAAPVWADVAGNPHAALVALAGGTAGAPPRLVVRVRPGVRLHEVVAGSWLVEAPAAAAAHVMAVQGALNAGGPADLAPFLTVTPALPDLASSLGMDRDFVLTLADPSAAGDMLAVLAACVSVVEVVEPLSAGFFTDHAVEFSIPSDPLFGSQFALRNTGQSVQGQIGVAGADIDAPEAWSRFVNRRPVVVALLDSGVANHPDLTGRLVPGWNTALNTSFTGDENSSHGTHLAGIIGAVSNNGVGVAGVWPTARIMPVKVSNAAGSIWMDWVASGIVWAADHDADILSISIGFNSPNAALTSAIQYASAQGCLIVASSGNVPSSPIVAPGRFPEVLCVGATDNRDVLVNFSATGPELDVVAPGYEIISTWHQWFAPNTYQYKSGTSQAVPHVAAVAAMVMSVNPWLSAAQTRMILLATTDDLGPDGWDPQYGHGRLDAGRAVAMAAAFNNPSGNPVTGCPADFNRDGRLTSEDFFLFLEFYVAKDPRADLVWPLGVWNGDDFLKYTDRYAAGCTP